MKNFATLLFLDRFRGLFERLGVDYSVMRRILYAKLLMDGRRVPTIFNQPNRKKNKTQKDVNHFIRSLWMYALLGLILIPFVALEENYIFQMSIVFAMLMFIIMTSMIADFSSVLLDIRDQNILHTKPVNTRTLGMAKTLHICIYLFFLTGAVTGIPLVVGLSVHGLFFFLIFVAEIILADLLIVVLTALLYFWILKFFDGEKLKDIINYVQIGLSIAIFVGYQVVIRAFDFMDLDVVFNPAWWQYFVPPIWFGAPFEWLLNGHADVEFVILSLVVLIVPILMIMVYVRLMPAFERNLQKLSDHSASNKKVRRRRKLTVARIVCPNKEERTFFRFASRMMNQEREFKLKVYPSLGFSIVIPFLFLFSQLQLNAWDTLAPSKWYLSVYGCMIVIPTVSLMLNYSGTYKGAWVFKAAPVRDLAKLYRGTLKAAIVRLFLPVYVIVSLIFSGLFGLQVIPHLIVALLAAFVYALICFKTVIRSIPFSEPFSTAQDGGGIRLLPLMLLMGAFGFVHWISTNFDYGIYAYMLLLVLMNLFGWKIAFKRSWETV